MMDSIVRASLKTGMMTESLREEVVGGAVLIGWGDGGLHAPKSRAVHRRVVGRALRTGAEFRVNSLCGNVLARARDESWRTVAGMSDGVRK